MTSTLAPVAGRSCGTCSLCCQLPEIEEFSKPANTVCHHCQPAKGCRIYDDRPQLCRDFFCRYMTDPDLSEAWNPVMSHMMVYAQGPQVTVLVDPAHANIWKSEPYIRDLRLWANEAHDDGGYLILYAGDDLTVMRP